MTKMSDFEKGFVIGILEGEGTFGIAKLTTRKNYIELQPKITISNTNLELLQYAKSILRNWRITGHTKPKTENWNDAWQLNLTGQDAISEFISEFLPYFIEKKKQATLLKQFCDLRLARIKEYGLPNAHYGEDEFMIYEELKTMNKRGRRD